jgi:predicted secreted acid phosphatase
VGRILSFIIPTICLLFTSYAFAQEPSNLATLRHKVTRYYHSGAYMQDAKSVVEKARKYIKLQINRIQNKHKKLAIVLDIDETSLSNYSKLEARSFIGDRETVHREIMSGGSPAIPPMLALYDEARKQGVAVFFVTGRTESEKMATIKNLKEAGYKKWTGLYMRPDRYLQESIIPFKTQARREISDLGYTIIASIGDQESDITGGYTLKGFKMPNPYYYVP